MEELSPGPGKPPRLVQTIFLNEQGLRAGWRVAIFLILAIFLVILLSSAIAALTGARGRAPSRSPGFLLMSEALSFLAVAIASWVMSRIERRSMGEYGLSLTGSAFLSRFAAGYVLWGFLPLSLLLLALRGLGAFYFGDIGLHGVEILSWAAMWGLVFIFVGLFEEYLFRGYLLCTLADGIGFWPATIILAVLFALGHAGNQSESRLGVVMTAAFAIFASVTFWRTGNLWLAVGAHAGWDWGQSFFYGVSDSGVQVEGHLLNPRIADPVWISGGAVGPEGSFLVLPLMVAMSVLIVVLYPRKKMEMPSVSAS